MSDFSFAEKGSFLRRGRLDSGDLGGRRDTRTTIISVLLENARHFGGSLGEVRQSAYPVTVHLSPLSEDVCSLTSYF